MIVRVLLHILSMIRCLAWAFAESQSMIFFTYLPLDLCYRYLHGVLSKNENVTESNKKLLVECLRAIAELLIWGDQNDSSVFEFVTACFTNIKNHTVEHPFQILDWSLDSFLFLTWFILGQLVWYPLLISCSLRESTVLWDILILKPFSVKTVFLQQLKYYQECSAQKMKIFSVFFWSDRCCHIFYQLWSRIAVRMCAYNYYKRWIYFLKIFVTRHHCASYFTIYTLYQWTKLIHIFILQASNTEKAYLCLTKFVVAFCWTIREYRCIFFTTNADLYSDYLLSNNHVNSIIMHKFDFDNEEIMAYYISFIKTLSFKLNIYTIHFFFNEASR